MNNKKKGGF
jgi:hypothetical protein